MKCNSKWSLKRIRMHYMKVKIVKNMKVMFQIILKLFNHNNFKIIINKNKIIHNKFNMMKNRHINNSLSIIKLIIKIRIIIKVIIKF
jgi:hypothetical protein